MDDEKHVNEPASTFTTLPDQIVSKPVVLERGGKPVLVLVPYEEYQRLQQIEMDVRAHQESSTFPRKRNTLQKALGMLAANQPAPSDADIEQWLHEHRTEKYG